jgi:hypothetical protein
VKTSQLEKGQMQRTGPSTAMPPKEDCHVESAQDGERRVDIIE